MDEVIKVNIERYQNGMLSESGKDNLLDLIIEHYRL